MTFPPKDALLEARPTRQAIIVFGGYGTFGRHVSNELARMGFAVTVAGRDQLRARRFARGLGPACLGTGADVTRRDACRDALRGHLVAVNCAGPFQALDATLLECCLEAGCHYVDIADDRRYVRMVRENCERFRQRGLTAAYGCSSLPGISGALALHLHRGMRDPIERARVTLFIGNKNPKGRAALRSLLDGLGKPIVAPQGTLFGFRDREVVSLPAPFGSRGVFNFDSPEYDLFPSLLGIPAVTVKLGFELRIATYAFAFLARLRAGIGNSVVKLLEAGGRLVEHFGCSGAAIMTELFHRDGSSRRAALLARSDGQRMAALPAALVARALIQAPQLPRGAVTAYELLGASSLVEGLASAGFELHSDAAEPDV